MISPTTLDSDTDLSLAELRAIKIRCSASACRGANWVYWLDCTEAEVIEHLTRHQVPTLAHAERTGRHAMTITAHSTLGMLILGAVTRSTMAS